MDGVSKRKGDLSREDVEIIETHVRLKNEMSLAKRTALKHYVGHL